ncbi:MAG: pentapeptide repeat-containing protein, partial [Oscillatoriales cyanobacterium]
PFRPVELFERLEDFYLRWCEGEFSDAPPESLPQKKLRLLRGQLKTQELGQRQIDIYAGLNVMILLLELHRYGQQRDELKDTMVFYPCGKPNTEGKLDDASRLLRLIAYSCCVGDSGFLQIVEIFFSGANLSGANLVGADFWHANLSGVNFSGANLIGANLIGANLSGVNFSDADLSDANLSRANLHDANFRGAELSGVNFIGANLSGLDLIEANLTEVNFSRANLSEVNFSRANLSEVNLSHANLTNCTFGDIQWDENTKWENIRGLDITVNVPEGLKQQLGMQ